MSPLRTSIAANLGACSAILDIMFWPTSLVSLPDSRMHGHARTHAIMSFLCSVLGTATFFQTSRVTYHTYAPSHPYSTLSFSLFPYPIHLCSSISLWAPIVPVCIIGSASKASVTLAIYQYWLKLWKENVLFFVSFRIEQNRLEERGIALTHFHAL